MSDALKLADILEDQVSPGSAFFADVVAELRRLHAECEGHRVIRAELARQNNALRTENTALREAAQEVLEAWDSLCNLFGWEQAHMSQYERLRAALGEKK